MAWVLVVQTGDNRHPVKIEVNLEFTPYYLAGTMRVPLASRSGGLVKTNVSNDPVSPRKWGGICGSDFLPPVGGRL